MPPNGPFREELSKIEDKIKAYKLLRRGEKEEEYTVVIRNNKTTFIEPPEKWNGCSVTKSENSLNAALNKTPNRLYWDGRTRLINY